MDDISSLSVAYGSLSMRECRKAREKPKQLQVGSRSIALDLKGFTAVNGRDGFGPS